MAVVLTPRQVIDQRRDAKKKPPKGNRAAYHPAGDRRQLTNGFLCFLHFDRRAVAGNAFPFSTGHLNPSISPALVSIDWLPLVVRPFADPVSGCDGRLPEYGYLHIADLVCFPL
jgi:hypothetical protein